MFYRIVCQTLLSALLAVQFGLVHATLTVTEPDDSGPGTLRDRIEIANPGDTIDFQAGLSGPITLESPLPTLDFDLTIQGPGADVITVSGANQFRVFFVDAGATVTISGLTIAEGVADGEDEEFGGGIWNLGTLTLTDSVVTGNVAVVAGGGIANDGTLIVQRSEIYGNSTADPDGFGAGGGIENFGGSVTIIDSTIANNTADFGGGIENGNDPDDNVGMMNILNSTISGNAAMFGGGISILSGTVTVINSTISGNSATDDGGGIENLDGATVVFSTIAGNSANAGGGILNSGDFTAKNSLVANSLDGDDCADFGSSFNATGDNLDTDGTCPGFGQTTPAALDLGPMADNGGPTATHALGQASAAVDAVAACTDAGSAAVNSDQRGVTRPQGMACDIGAFELEAVGDPEVSLDPDSVNFGNVGVGSGSSLVTVTVENTGGGDLEIGTLSVSGSNAAEFAIFSDECSEQTVAPGAACTFRVGFTPSEEGERNAQVNIPSNADSSPETLPLTGTGVDTADPLVSLDPDQLDFGDIDQIGQPSPALQVTVTNTGAGDLEIGTLSIGGPQAGDFSFGGDLCGGQIVAPDANCTFEVIFTPQEAGVRRARVSIPSNAPGSPHRVDLLGTQDVIFFDGFESDQ